MQAIAMKNASKLENYLSQVQTINLNQVVIYFYTRSMQNICLPMINMVVQ